jgi:hypothetical protein
MHNSFLHNMSLMWTVMGIMIILDSIMFFMMLKLHKKMTELENK